MKKLFWAFILLLLPSLSWGGAARRAQFNACKPPNTYGTAVNGITSVDANIAPNSTGIIAVSLQPTCSPVAVSVRAFCDGGTGSSNVQLIINGSVEASVDCVSGESWDDTLTVAVSSNYTVNVVAHSTGGGAAYADTFSIPSD